MKIKGVKKIYKVGDGTVVALDGVSFNLPQTGMVFVLGKSGSGKSTLLNLLSGLDRADEGSIHICGKDITKCDEGELSKYRNSFCGFIFQEYNLISELNVGENIKLSLQLQGEDGSDEKVKEALKQVGLEGYENRKVTELSGGQKQRIAIARAIIKDPKIIFADEPTGALDERTGKSILELLKGFSADRLVVVVTHDREFAEEYGDRVIELADGKVISDSISEEKEAEERKSEWKKPKLPIRAALKIGCGNFKYHPIRLVATIILSIISFTFLGISLNISVNDDINSYIKAVHDNNIRHTAIYKRYKVPISEGITIEELLGGPSLTSRKTHITRADMDFFNVYKGEKAFVFEPFTGIYSFQKNYKATLDQLNAATKTSEEHINVSADGYVSIKPEECEKYGFTLVGKWPENTDEVAINECMLNVFKVAGLIEDNVTYPIKSAEDIIGHKISISHVPSVDDYKTICGVVNTGCSKECRLYNHSAENLHEKIFVCEDYFSEFTYCMCTVDSDFDAFARAVMSYDKNNNVFSFSDEVSSAYYGALYKKPILRTIALYLSIIFFVCAFIMLINFIAVSMRSQMKQIGILSSLGVDFRQMVKIYMGGALSIGAIVALGTLPLTVIMVFVLKHIIMRMDNFDWLAFNGVIIPILLVVIFCAVVIGCIIPLLKLRKASPIETINKGQIK